MKAGGQSGGYAHDDSEVDILGVFASRGILEGLDGPSGVLLAAECQFFRHGLEQAYEPAARGEDEEHPKSRDHCDYQVQREVHYVFSSAFGGEGSANNPDCYKEGQAVEKGPKDSYGELEF